MYFYQKKFRSVEKSNIKSSFKYRFETRNSDQWQSVYLHVLGPDSECQYWKLLNKWGGGVEKVAANTAANFPNSISPSVYVFPGGEKDARSFSWEVIKW